MNTTLNEIRKHEPCTKGWEKLLKHLGKTTADDELLTLSTVLESNGLEDALWCWSHLGSPRHLRLFSVWCARKVQQLMTDQRSLHALDVAERFANGDAAQYEMDAARTAAMSAAKAATSLADWNAAMAAAWAAAWTAAWNVAMSAARAAARAAAWNADWDDAMSAARNEQEKELSGVFIELEAGRDPYPLKEKVSS